MADGSRRFPPPWRADKIPGGYVVRDANGQALAARSTRNLLNVLAALTERGAGFRSLKDIWADTTTPHGRLMLTVLGGLAEFEQELIRARTGEGRERAVKDGYGSVGRPR
jgi:DNA invertase Pin-like site-specific DNA recombinase